ncbi:hypothetical protein [Priestia megaterium]|uniref:hypothetical protein n=1 Tax=Priestia megaterium TaxID=1404 RepID=UPI00064C6AAE|nr:hypothetical protein [Priestia megaterium]KLV28663.1 hypothetical protein ABW04_28555 [Priestia megaterium]
MIPKWNKKRTVIAHTSDGLPTVMNVEPNVATYDEFEQFLWLSIEEPDVYGDVKTPKSVIMPLGDDYCVEMTAHEAINVFKDKHLKS